jgi:hypothetical protein
MNLKTQDGQQLMKVALDMQSWVIKVAKCKQSSISTIIIAVAKIAKDEKYSSSTLQIIFLDNASRIKRSKFGFLETFE